MTRDTGEPPDEEKLHADPGEGHLDDKADGRPIGVDIHGLAGAVEATVDVIVLVASESMHSAQEPVDLLADPVLLDLIDVPPEAALPGPAAARLGSEPNVEDLPALLLDTHDPHPPAPPPSGSAPSSGAGTGQRSGSRWSSRDRERERALLALMATLDEGDPQRQAARDELITMHLPLAQYLARRFRDRGEPLEDLTQVATIGLVKAVDRFSVDRGVEFSTFATPTILGEIKRHFRDKGWAIRVPRRLQERRLAIARATNELSHAGHGSPTVAQLAAHMGISEDEILEGLESAQAYSTLSLDASSEGGEESQPISETVGGLDPALQHVITQTTVHPLLATLPPRERRIVELRFFHEMTQSQIAEQMGISQMHVSRLLARSLAQLRTTMDE